MFTTTPSIYSVSELTHSLKNLLEGTYRFITLRGEISNLKTPYSGHSYFTLKDETAQIRAVLFKNQKRYLLHSLKDGNQIICHGRISLYEPRGEYQVIIDTVEEDGNGRLQQRYEKIKNDLAEKGYFSEERKKRLPLFPQKIIVISSPTGAAIQDFLKIHELRNSTTHIQLIPVQVQGALAAGQIAKAIERANSTQDTDAIVICRGGGSIEDLWAFNEIEVAKAIYASVIPIVSAVGHETDFTIADFCADLRAATPTGAAEQLLFDSHAIREAIASHRNRQIREMDELISHNQYLVRQSIKGLGRIEHSLDKYKLRMQLTTSYLERAMLDTFTRLGNRVETISARLKEEAPLHKIEMQDRKVKELKRRLYRQINQNVQDKERQLAQQAGLLHTISPLATLSRGYSVTRKISVSTGKPQLITNNNQVELGDMITVQLDKGLLDCTVEGKR